MVGSKSVFFMDEISTGLDSSTTYAIVKFLRDQTHALNYTTMISLLQPAPESYDLFDDILLLAGGSSHLIFTHPAVTAPLQCFHYHRSLCIKSDLSSADPHAWASQLDPCIQLLQGTALCTGKQAAAGCCLCTCMFLTPSFCSGKPLPCEHGFCTAVQRISQDSAVAQASCLLPAMLLA